MVKALKWHFPDFFWGYCLSAIPSLTSIILYLHQYQCVLSCAARLKRRNYVRIFTLSLEKNLFFPFGLLIDHAWQVIGKCLRTSKKMIWVKDINNSLFAQGALVLNDRPVHNWIWRGKEKTATWLNFWFLQWPWHSWSSGSGWIWECCLCNFNRRNQEQNGGQSWRFSFHWWAASFEHVTAAALSIPVCIIFTSKRSLLLSNTFFIMSRGTAKDFSPYEKISHWALPPPTPAPPLPTLKI